MRRFNQFICLLILTSTLLLSQIQITRLNSSDQNKTDDLNKIDQSIPLILIDGMVLNQIGTLNFQSNDKLKATAESFGWNGTGTKNDPYIIENLYFSQLYDTSYHDSIILFNNTNLYVELVRLYFEFDTSIHSAHSAIKIMNSSNILISSCYFNSTSLDNNQFVDIQDSTNITITFNYFKTFYSGMIANQFSNVNNSQVFSNYYGHFDNGILINDRTKNITISDNEFNDNNHAIDTAQTEYLSPKDSFINILSNYFINNSEGLQASITSYNIIKNIFSSNIVAISARRSLNSNITQNYFLDNYAGIELRKQNQIFKLNCDLGYFIPECSEVQSLPYNDFFQLHQSNITITNNLFTNQSEYNIYINNHSDGNDIYYNNFYIAQNFDSVFDDFGQNTTNYFNNATIGNYWEDYNGSDNNNDQIGDTPYKINQSSSDDFPSMFPFNITKPEITSHSEFYYLNRLVFVAPTTTFETVTNPPTSTGPLDSTIDTTNSSLPIGITEDMILIGGVLLTGTAGIGIFIIYEYRKEVAKNTLKHRNTSFIHFLRDKLSFKKSQVTEKPTLSDETLRELEEIIEENKD